MCGIAGIFVNQPCKPPALEKALDSLHHRGPDDWGLWSAEGIYLAHTRLAILDVSSLGHQPMSYQNQRYWITFNGEIYNYLELRQELAAIGYSFKSQTDTEVLLAAYAHWGTGCLEKLRGMFAFAIWDQQTDQLFIARDRTGEKPLYYWMNEDGLYFASELKALLALLPFVPALDPVAIDQYLHYQYVPEPLTPLKGIFKLPAAHFAVIDRDDWQLQPHQYWNLANIEPVSGDRVELIRHELNQVIELTLRSDVPVGVALSGGIDSGAIAALAAPKYKDVLQAFSVGYPGRPACDERDEAKQLADQLGLPFNDVELHTENLVQFFPQLVQAMDDPIGDIAAYGHFAVTKLAAAKGVKVVLGGIGGDELFWGYDWVTKAIQLTEQKKELLAQGASSPWLGAGIDYVVNSLPCDRVIHSRKLPGAVRSKMQQTLDTSFMALQHPEQAVFYNVRNDFRNAWSNRRSLYTHQFLEQIPLRNPFLPFTKQNADWSDAPIEMNQLLFDTWLVSNCLALGDRVSMASSLEVRLPLLDHKLIELVVGLRKDQPDHQLGHKFWLKQALRGILPDEVLNRPKRGFEPPYGEWIKALVENYGDRVIDGYLVKHGFFNGAAIEKLFRNYRQHFSTVYRLIVLEIWYRSVVLQEVEDMNCLAKQICLTTVR